MFQGDGGRAGVSGEWERAGVLGDAKGPLLKVHLQTNNQAMTDNYVISGEVTCSRQCSM